MTSSGSRKTSICLILTICNLLHCITVNFALRKTRRITSTKRTARRTTRRTAPKLTANTPLPVTSYSSSIIKSHALNATYPQSFRSRFLTGAVAGALVYSYAYSANRVYSEIYTPYVTSNIRIPRKRALRIAREEYQI